MKEKNNPNAFPGMESSAFGQDTGHYHGMSLRDYFASKAMQGIMSEYLSKGSSNGYWSDYDAIAKEVYEIADAMLKQRDL